MTATSATAPIGAAAALEIRSSEAIEAALRRTIDLHVELLRSIHHALDRSDEGYDGCGEVNALLSEYFASPLSAAPSATPARG